MVSHWNPKSVYQWIGFSDYVDRIKYSMQIDPMVYDQNPNLEIVTLQISAPAFKIEAFQSGITNITYLSEHMFNFDVLNYENDSLPYGTYEFSHHPILLCSSEEIGDCDNEKRIVSYGAKVEISENETRIKYDKLHDDWGIIYPEENYALLNNFSFYIISFSLFVMYSIRKTSINKITCP